MLFCEGCKGSQVCKSKYYSFTVQRFLPRVPLGPTPFCRTRSLLLTVLVMMRHCLQLEPLKRKTDVKETCLFPFDPACSLYMHRDLEMENAVYVGLNGFIATWPRADVSYDMRFCIQRKAVEFVNFYEYLSTTKGLQVYIWGCSPPADLSFCDQIINIFEMFILVVNQLDTQIFVLQ